MKKIALMICALMISMPAIDARAQEKEMTVEEAYAAVNHQRTQFKKVYAKMSQEEARYLEHLFFVTDLALRERMIMMRHFAQKRDEDYIEKYNAEIDNLLESFKLVSAPSPVLENVEDLVTDAIKEQKRFFEQWAGTKGTKFYSSWYHSHAFHPLVQSSHGKLLRAYSLLVKDYKSEGMDNKQAFYDHLCALDFI